MIRTSSHAWRRVFQIGAFVVFGVAMAQALWRVGVPLYRGESAGFGLTFGVVVSSIYYLGNVAAVFVLWSFVGKLVRMLPDEGERRRMRGRLLWVSVAIWAWLFLIAFPLALITMPRM